ncbi:hypothetical protein [Williamsia sp. CHRR-6]|uniref:hypothetical protein n=1 Tax=Williamsia sp. CHRR-6 TaxID=2835871 RepID=UPI001BDB2F27|nr:hypothetical protein [Williamsia sp. CHRR-6]MBT0568542.1 hypothetical protein [Williamsia sp. CHRR-6]
MTYAVHPTHTGYSPSWRAVDSTLTAIGAAALTGYVVVTALISLTWPDRAAAACRSDGCVNVDAATAMAYVDGVGVLALLLVATVSLLLISRRSPALWVPIVGIAVHTGLWMAAQQLLPAAA